MGFHPSMAHRAGDFAYRKCVENGSNSTCEPPWNATGNATAQWDGMYNDTRRCYPKYVEEWKQGNMVPGEEEVGREVLVELDRDVGPLSLEEVEFAAMLSHHRKWPALGMVPVDDMLNTGLLS